MKSFKKFALMGSLGLCLITCVPEQKAHAEAALTLGIIGTILGGTALGTQILDRLGGGNQNNYPIYYPTAPNNIPPIIYSNNCGCCNSMPAVPPPPAFGGGCCQQQQMMMNYNSCGMNSCSSPVYPPAQAIIPIEQQIVPLPIYITTQQTPQYTQPEPLYSPPIIPDNTRVVEAPRSTVVRGLW